MPRQNSLLETMTQLQRKSQSRSARRPNPKPNAPVSPPVPDDISEDGAQPLRVRSKVSASTSSTPTDNDSADSATTSPVSHSSSISSDMASETRAHAHPPPHSAELTAFLAWLSSLSPSSSSSSSGPAQAHTPLTSLRALTDGAVLLSLLARASPSHFPPPAAGRHLTPADPWPLRLTQLKSLYRRVSQWYEEMTRGERGEEWTPELGVVVKDDDDDDGGDTGSGVTGERDADREPDSASTSGVGAGEEKLLLEERREREMLKLLRLVIGVAVQGENKEEAVLAIRGLPTESQTQLMRAIERVMSAFPPRAVEKAGDVEREGDAGVMTDDDHYYQLQSARSRLQSENSALQSSLSALQAQLDTLQVQTADLQAERDDALASVRELRRAAEERKSEKLESGLRAEIERLKDELRKSEDNLSAAESQLQRHEVAVGELTRRVGELQEKAEEAGRLKDQVDEWRHTAERYQKNENVIEKYKRKLEETADLRRQIKALTEQNTQLVNTNSQLESQSSKSANMKPLLDAYKQQISDLESKASARGAEVEGLRLKLDDERRRREEVERLRAAERREADEWAERVRELEGAGRTPGRRRTGTGDSGEEPLSPGVEGEDPLGMGMGAGTLDDALSGTTMTDLKLRIRALERELQAAQDGNGSASRVLVLENLLEDAVRLKARYEREYLASHREALVMRRELEEIRAGKGGADSGEMVIALRQRLNEVVDELDGLKKRHEEQGVELDAHKRELTIARSDLNLVNKDQLEILASLRASVSSDNAGLSGELDRMRQVERDLREKNRMQMDQVNALLMEKVEMQGEGIGQREAMLRRERDIGDLRASIAGKDLPEDTKKRLMELADENARLKEEMKGERQKLVKARQFIKEQDELFNKQHAGKVDPNTFLEAEQSYKAQIKSLEDKIALLKRTIKENTTAFDREKQSLQSSFRVLGQQQRQSQLRSAVSRTGTRLQPQSWLAQQRESMMADLSRSSS